MDDYRQHLRRLAVHDEALLEASATEEKSFPPAVIDDRTTALVRIAMCLIRTTGSSSRLSSAIQAKARGSASAPRARKVVLPYPGGATTVTRGASEAHSSAITSPVATVPGLEGRRS